MAMSSVFYVHAGVVDIQKNIKSMKREPKRFTATPGSYHCMWYVFDAHMSSYIIVCWLRVMRSPTQQLSSSSCSNEVIWLYNFPVLFFCLILVCHRWPHTDQDHRLIIITFFAVPTTKLWVSNIFFTNSRRSRAFPSSIHSCSTMAMSGSFWSLCWSRWHTEEIKSIESSS